MNQRDETSNTNVDPRQTPEIADTDRCEATVRLLREIGELDEELIGKYATVPTQDVQILSTPQEADRAKKKTSPAAASRKSGEAKRAMVILIAAVLVLVLVGGALSTMVLLLRRGDSTVTDDDGYPTTAGNWQASYANNSRTQSLHGLTYTGVRMELIGTIALGTETAASPLASGTIRANSGVAHKDKTLPTMNVAAKTAAYSGRSTLTEEEKIVLRLAGKWISSAVAMDTRTNLEMYPQEMVHAQLSNRLPKGITLEQMLNLIEDNVSRLLPFDSVRCSYTLFDVTVPDAKTSKLKLDQLKQAGVNTDKIDRMLRFSVRLDSLTFGDDFDVMQGENSTILTNALAFRINGVWYLGTNIDYNMSLDLFQMVPDVGSLTERQLSDQVVVAVRRGYILLDNGIAVWCGKNTEFLRDIQVGDTIQATVYDWMDIIGTDRITGIQYTPFVAVRIEQRLPTPVPEQTPPVETKYE